MVALLWWLFEDSVHPPSLAVNSLASGMKLKDDAMATYETIKEDAKDICYEAKAKNEGE